MDACHFTPFDDLALFDDLVLVTTPFNDSYAPCATFTRVLSFNAYLSLCQLAVRRLNTMLFGPELHRLPRTLMTLIVNLEGEDGGASTIKFHRNTPEAV